MGAPPPGPFIPCRRRSRHPSSSPSAVVAIRCRHHPSSSVVLLILVKLDLTLVDGWSTSRLVLCGRPHRGRRGRRGRHPRLRRSSLSST